MSSLLLLLVSQSRPHGLMVLSFSARSILKDSFSSHFLKIRLEIKKLKRPNTSESQVTGREIRNAVPTHHILVVTVEFVVLYTFDNNAMKDTE